MAGGGVWWEAQGFIKVESESLPSSVFSMAKLRTGQTEWNGAESQAHRGNGRGIRSDRGLGRAGRSPRQEWGLKAGVGSRGKRAGGRELEGPEAGELGAGEERWRHWESRRH